MRFSCPACSHMMQCRDDLAGRKCRCPKCGQKVLIPTLPKTPTATNKATLGKLEPDCSSAVQPISSDTQAPPYAGPALLPTQAGKAAFDFPSADGPAEQPTAKPTKYANWIVAVGLAGCLLGAAVVISTSAAWRQSAREAWGKVLAFEMPKLKNFGGANQKAVEANEWVTRANFNALRNGMKLPDAVAILGPPSESSHAGVFMNVTWRSQSGRCTILATFVMEAEEPARHISIEGVGASARQAAFSNDGTNASDGLISKLIIGD